MQNVKVGNFEIGMDAPLVVISGPCVMESESLVMSCAEFLVKQFESRPINLIFKSSYDKANRSSIKSFRGPGIDAGLKILERVKTTFNLPIFTDVHTPQEARQAAEVCDVIQIPAFLCRQTDLLIEAGKTGCVINIKKGQFMAPWDMEQPINKLKSTGNEKIMITERGTSFGYNNLVSDMRAIPIMQKLGLPVIYDATHSVQLPGGLGDQSGGNREFVPVLSKAAIAAGCNGIYAESHPCPDEAKCDGPTMLTHSSLSALLDSWERLYQC